LLALLMLLWPSETAGPEYDHGPDWLPPEQEFKEKLREVSLAAQQVRSELAASRQRKIYKREGDYCREWTVPKNWIYPPGKRPCDVIESGGPGPSKGGRYDWV
jgi:hypothetical protein